MRFRNERRTIQRLKPSVDVTACVSVIFLLLLFFLLSSTFKVNTSIPIKVSQAEGTAQFEQKELSITLSNESGGPDNQGKIFVDDAEITSWDELTKALLSLKERDDDPLVLIRPDARVPAERLIKVLGLTGSAGITHYGIEAQAPQPEAP